MRDSVAVLIPCFNEEKTIAKVVRDVRRELPAAAVYVYDNNSTDRTVERAKAAGARIGFEQCQGKGHVVRTMFREVRADLYVMLDGDDTYDVAKLRAVMAPVASGACDMAVGTRLESHVRGAFPSQHKLGNEMIRGLINRLFGVQLRDVLSGYRCFNRKFVESVPLLCRGFEVEVELTIQALDKDLIIAEVPTDYGIRPEGSDSKLNTLRDGILIVKTILRMFKDYRPLKFYGALGGVALLIGLGFGLRPLMQLFATGAIGSPAMAVLATALLLCAGHLFGIGLVLASVDRGRREHDRIFMNHAAHREMLILETLRGGSSTARRRVVEGRDRTAREWPPLMGEEHREAPTRVATDGSR